MDEQELEDIIGRVAMEEYRAAPAIDQATIPVWAAALRNFTDMEFVEECSRRIDESIQASSRGFSEAEQGIWCRSSACLTEARRRHEEAGHERKCGGDTLYVDAYNIVLDRRGAGKSPRYPCDCGRG